MLFRDHLAFEEWIRIAEHSCCALYTRARLPLPNADQKSKKSVEAESIKSSQKEASATLSVVRSLVR